MTGNDPRERRSGILGGTFDPPHVAHVALATAARDALRLDRVLFIPAANPWRKADRPVSSAADRLAMLRAAVADLPWAEVSTIEIDRGGPTYTADTLAALAAAGGTWAEAWWFILGEDALQDLPHWHDPARILAHVRLAVARRDAAKGSARKRGALVTRALAAALPGLAARVDEVPMTPLDVSATEIRARVRAGESTEGLLPAAVRAVIDARGLYR